MKKPLLLIFLNFLFFFSAHSIFAQSKIDSITRLINKEKNIEKKNALYLERAIEYEKEDSLLAFEDLENAFNFFSKTKNQKGVIDAWNVKSLYLVKINNLISAEYFDSLAFANAKKINYKKGIFYSYYSKANLEKKRGKIADAERNLNFAKDLIPDLKNELKPEIIIIVYNQLGSSKSGMGKYDEAIEFLNKSLEFANKEENKEAEISILINLANTYARIGSYEKSIEYNLKSMRLAEKLNDSKNLLKIYNNIAITYKRLIEYEKALNYYNKSLELAKSHKIYKSMGLASMNMGIVNVNLKNFDEAQELFKKAIEYFEFTHDARDLGLANHNYGNFLMDTHQYDLAEEFLQKGLEYRKQTESKPEIAKSLAALGKLKLNQNQINEAETYLIEAENLLKNNNQSIEALNDLYIYLKELYLKKNDYKKAFEYQQKEITIRNKMFDESEKVNALKLQVEYELEKKDESLKLQKENQRRKQLYFYSIAGFIVLSLILFLMYLIQKRKQVKQKHQSELVQIQQEHRLNLADSLSKAEQEERKKIANKLHDETGGILSIAKLNIDQLEENMFVAGSEADEKLKSTKKLLTEASESIRNISHSLMPVALDKYGLKAGINELVNAINTSGKIKIEEIIEGLDNTKNWSPQLKLTIYRMVQEVFNNIIKHSQATHVLMQIVEFEDTVTIYIEDNGKGIDKKNNSDGIGMKMLKQNIEYLHGKVEIDGKENKGTFVLAELPIVKQNLA